MNHEVHLVELYEAVADELRRSSEMRVGASLSPSATRALFDRHLTSLLEAFAHEIITAAEVATAITDRFVVALADEAQLPLVETISAPWDETAARVTALIERYQDMINGKLG